MQALTYLKNGFINKKVLLATMDSPFLDNNLVFPYLGILHLAAIADNLGINVNYVNKSDYPLTPKMLKYSTFFYTDEFDQENIEIYKDFDLIGLSCVTPQTQQAYKIRSLIKRHYPHIKVMIGGPHAHYYKEECVREGFDMVCLGDGERIFESILCGNIKMLERLLHPSTTEDTLIFQDQLSESEMNTYPIPLRQKEYLSRYKYLMRGRLATTLVNSRGCPMRCEFCEHRLTRPRWHSVEHFKASVESVISLGIHAIMIFDDLFAISPNKIEPYIEILKKYHYESDLIFRCFGHAKVIAKFPEMVNMLAEAGCVEMGFGAESASQMILDNVSKGTKVGELHKFINYSIEAGIDVKAFFIIGLPGETHESFMNTYQFIKYYRKKYPDNFDFDLSVFFPYKGTRIGQIIRLPEGTAVTDNGKQYTRKSIQLKARPDLDWTHIDRDSYGAYKKKSGSSDLIIETYDWDTQKTLLSAQEIKQLKDKTMLLSKRYKDIEGRQISTPLIEGSIGSLTQILNPVGS